MRTDFNAHFTEPVTEFSTTLHIKLLTRLYIQVFRGKEDRNKAGFIIIFNAKFQAAKSEVIVSHFLFFFLYLTEQN